MRRIDYIVLHCSATYSNTSVQSILNYWKNNLGWKNPGYHLLIDKDGISHKLAPFSKITNGVKGYNQNSIHIGYIGGVDNNNKVKDTRTLPQLKTMFNEVLSAMIMFPKAKVLGHRDFPGVNKDCPSFDAKTWLKATGLVK